MELAEYIRLGRKWLWLLIVSALVGGGISFIINTGRAPLYTANSTVSIGRYIDSPNPDQADIQTGIGLAQTYAQLIRTSDVLQGTVDALNLALSPQQLNNLFTTNILTGTSLMVVRVTYTDPVLAAEIANTLAQQLIQRSPTNLTAGQQSQIDYATLQIEALDTQLQEQRVSLQDVNAQLADETDPTEIARLTDLRTSLTEQTTQAAAAIAQFQSTISSIQQRTNALDIVERASIPTTPQGNGAASGALVGAAVGVFLAAGAVLLIEYLDDRVKTTEMATQILDLNVLGAIPQFGKKNADYSERLMRKEDSMSPVAEAYRRLQTNLMFNASGHQNVFVITSAGPEEGKSVTAANLAATMANDGIRVLLIDADLRRPRQHQVFNLDNEVGLSTLLIAQHDQERPPVANLNQCIQSTGIPHLKVITSGFLPSNPTQALRSPLMKRWIDAFRASKDIDVIIIDTPPVLLFGDSSVIASVAEADAVMVINTQRTRGRAAQETKSQLEQVGVQVKGVILNRVNPRDEAGTYGYGYGYGYGYYYAEDRNDVKKPRRSLLPLRRTNGANGANGTEPDDE